MAFRSFPEERRSIGRDDLKTFVESKKSGSPLRPFFGKGDITIEFNGNEPSIVFTPFTNNEQRNEDDKFVEIKTSVGYLPLNCFGTKTVVDFSTKDVQTKELAGILPNNNDLLSLYDEIKNSGKKQAYKVARLPYIGRNDSGRLYSSYAYTLVKA